MKLIKYFLAIFIFGLSLSVMTPVFAVADSSTLSGLEAAAGGVKAYKDQVTNNKDAKATVISRVGGIVGLILSFVGVIFLILTIYAGLMWMTASGNSGQVDKAKSLLINALIGLIIITAAYSIVSFIGTNIINPPTVK